MRDDIAFSTYFERAVEMDKLYKLPEAIGCYRNCISKLSELLDDLEKESISYELTKRKQIYEIKMDQMSKRVTTLRSCLGESYRNKQIHIEINERDTNKSYKTLLSEYFDASVQQVLINDPYIRTKGQVSNLLKFIELVVLKCENLKVIRLVTCADPEGIDYQTTQFSGIQYNLTSFGAVFEYSFSSTLHDRSIKIDNGWVIKIGRGLDYFYNCSDYFAPGYFDLDLRPCRETSIDIFHNPMNITN